MMKKFFAAVFNSSDIRGTYFTSVLEVKSFRWNGGCGFCVNPQGGRDIFFSLRQARTLTEDGALVPSSQTPQKGSKIFAVWRQGRVMIFMLEPQPAETVREFRVLMEQETTRKSLVGQCLSDTNGKPRVVFRGTFHELYGPKAWECFRDSEVASFNGDTVTKVFFFQEKKGGKWVDVEDPRPAIKNEGLVLS